MSYVHFIHDPFQQAVTMSRKEACWPTVQITSSTWLQKAPLAVGILCLEFTWVTNIFTLCGHFKVPATYLSPHPLFTDFLMVWFPGLDYLDKLLAISLKSLWIFSFVHISFQTNSTRYTAWYSAHWEDFFPLLSFLTTPKLDYDAT